MTKMIDLDLYVPKTEQERLDWAETVQEAGIRYAGMNADPHPRPEGGWSAHDREVVETMHMLGLPDMLSLATKYEGGGPARKTQRRTGSRSVGI